MKDLPAGFDIAALLPALAEGWGIVASSANYVPVGFGSYHWIATDVHQQRFFVTVDDLDNKSFLGNTCEATFDGLRTAFDVAAALRERCGLEFVHAPLETLDGDTVRRVGRRHSIAVFAFVDGAAGEFGDHDAARHGGALVSMLVDLHRATPVVRDAAATRGLEFDGRSRLEAALRDVDRPWCGGPFAEPARALLAGHAREVARRLRDFDRLVGEVAAMNRPLVITHGEPHPGNVMHSDDRLVLIDWDTVGLALPERDLWMVIDASSEEASMYADATGHEVSSAALDLYRHAWDLAEVAIYVDQFRSRHDRTDDTQEAWRNLEGTLRPGQR